MAYNYFPTGYQQVIPQAYVPQGNSFQNGTIIYLKSADASGMPSIKILDYTIRDNAPQKPNIQPQTDFATKDDVVALQREINALKSKFGERKEAKK